MGGIVAFEVNGNLTLSHTLSASGIGFRGGDRAQNEDGECEDDIWRTTSGDDAYADKGEGIYIITAGERAGRAKALNGGGGGIIHNGGGGGGGNYTTGGAGYFGYDGEGCSAFNSAGGQGGLALASSASRVFMGGGGGGAQGNNGHATDGGDGGGMIFVRCDTLIVRNGIQARIQANGDAGDNTTGHDGAGGGGAGGSVVLNIKGVRVQSTGSLLISANGANGGNVVHSDIHGSGGGGGQGTILISANGPFTNTTLQTNNGIGGLASTDAGAPRAGSGGSANGAGIKFGQGVVLPVQLSAFSAQEIEPRVVKLLWTTKSERQSAFFDVYRSTGKDWEHIGRVEAAGNSDAESNYELIDRDPVRGDNYYRLRQVDYDGREEFSEIIHVTVEDLKIPVRLYPNPAKGEITLESEFDLSAETIRVFSSAGVLQNCGDRVAGMKRKLDLTGLPPGIYFIISERIREMVAVQ